MKICVTKMDIWLGTPGKPATCPVARAIKRATGKRYVYVYPENAYIANKEDETEGAATTHQLPQAVGDFIDKFDLSDLIFRFGMKPFDFELDEPVAAPNG